MQDSLDRAVSAPLLEAAMTGLIGRVALRQILPRGAGAEDPQDAVQHIARIAPRPAPTVGPTRRSGNQGLNERPLGIGQVHAALLRGGLGGQHEEASNVKVHLT